MDDAIPEKKDQACTEKKPLFYDSLFLIDYAICVEKKSWKRSPCSLAFLWNPAVLQIDTTEKVVSPSVKDYYSNLSIIDKRTRITSIRPVQY